jgi:formate dehydrogenase (NADP+) beta subunit
VRRKTLAAAEGIMGNLAFCCLEDRVIDNRGKPAGARQMPDDLKLPQTFKIEDDVKAYIAWNGFWIADESVSVVAVCRAYLEACQAEASCGECFPCRVGTQIAAELLGKFCDGVATEDDLTQLADLLEDIRRSSKCQVGQTVPKPVLMALDHFRAEFRACIGSGKRLDPVSLKTRVAAPCTEACPAHLDIPQYVEDIKKRRYLDSSDVARAGCVMPTVLGRVCVRPCESACRRANVDEAVQIKYLKRFASDYEMTHGQKPHNRHVAPPSGKKVAVIGAGPAGLAAAEKLAQLGHQVTIYEALGEGGGMAAVGIPDYRLPRAVLRREIELIQELGVEVLYNQRIGETGPSWDDLKTKLGFEAIFIGVGAHNSNKLRAKGEDDGFKGFVHGVAFLRAAAEGKAMPEGKRIAVVGGGNVAIDCVRTALRLGFSDVNIIYRRTEKEMPADHVEITDAHEEGVTFNYLCNPTRLIANADGKLTGVELIRMELGEPDASGRRRPVPMEGSEFVMDVDVLIPAIGQSPNLEFLQGESGLEFTRWNTVVADEITGATALPDVFSGGDCLTGAATLIEAVAAGNRAAVSIDRFLRGASADLDDAQRMEKLMRGVKVYDPDEAVAQPPGLARRWFEHLPPAERIHHFEEVEAVMTAADATIEATRCLRCYRLSGVLV